MADFGTKPCGIGGWSSIKVSVVCGWLSLLLMSSIRDHHFHGHSRFPTNGAAFAYEICGSGNHDGDSEGTFWLSQNDKSASTSNSNSNIMKVNDKGFYCPSQNTCCRMMVEGDVDWSWGCVASDMGARNATCCSDNDRNTGCPSGFECRRRRSEERSLSLVFDCVRSTTNRSNGQDDNGDPLMKVLPRYRLCRAEESNRILYGLTVPVPSSKLLDSKASIGNQSQSQIAYYSNLGPIESNAQNKDMDKDDLRRRLSGVEMALVIVHGANRNGDDYFCSAKATIGLQKRYNAANNNTILVIAPLFLQSPNATSKYHPLRAKKTFDSSSFLYWKDIEDKDGSWRYGADASGPVMGVSSFDAMDAILKQLQNTRVLPNLRRVVVAGHSSGGQFVQRWSLLTPSDVWPSSLALQKENKMKSWDNGKNTTHKYTTIKAIVANPSSYAYLTPLRFFDNIRKSNDNINGISHINGSDSISRNRRTESSSNNITMNKSKSNLHDSSWKVPPIEDCPGYNQWEWGMDDGGPLDVPYRKRALSRHGRSGIIDRYLQHRSVIYLVGNLDRCSPEIGNCESHGLETTCADELQGRNRYERNAQYFASLELVAGDHKYAGDPTAVETSTFLERNHDGRIRKSPYLIPHQHRKIVVLNVGHDHSMMFQSNEGIIAIYDDD